MVRSPWFGPREAWTTRSMRSIMQQGAAPDSSFRNEPAVWRRIQLNGMAKDFSWQVSAIEYAKLYEAACKSRNQTAATSSNQPRVKSAKISPVAPLGKGSHGR